MIEQTNVAQQGTDVEKHQNVALPDGGIAAVEHEEIVRVPVSEVRASFEQELSDASRMTNVVDQDVESLQKLLDTAKKKGEVLKQFKTISLGQTNYRDWVNRSGKYSMTSTGAEKIRAIWGITISIPKYPKEHKLAGQAMYPEKIMIPNDPKSNYQYLMKGVATSKVFGSIEDAEGSCSSKDSFFAVKRSSGGAKYNLELIDIDEMFIRKAAISNFIVNAVTRLCGLRSVTTEELAEAGIKAELVQSISYDSAGEKDGRTDEQKADSGKVPISEPQLRRAHALAAQAGVNEVEMKAWVQYHLKLDHLKDIPRSEYDRFCQWIEMERVERAKKESPAKTTNGQKPITK